MRFCYRTDNRTTHLISCRQVYNNLYLPVVYFEFYPRYIKFYRFLLYQVISEDFFYTFYMTMPIERIEDLRHEKVCLNRSWQKQSKSVKRRLTTENGT